MKSNRQARHILGLNYKISNQQKVVIEDSHETVIAHATGRKRHAGK
jgi:stationary-phase-induced ribosome-associated protein